MATECIHVLCVFLIINTNYFSMSFLCCRNWISIGIYCVVEVNALKDFRSSVHLRPGIVGNHNGAGTSWNTAMVFYTD
jgi:hypothetical protein